MKPHEIISEILTQMANAAKPGVKILDIDKIAEDLIKKYGATSCNKGYKPKWAKSKWDWVSCINYNSIIAHGKPNDYILQEGDIVSFDLGIKKDGECADAALTVGVGEISDRRKRLLYYAKQTVYEAIKLMVPGASTENIARAIEYNALSKGFLVNRRFAGHRIGAEMHMKPNIFNTTEPGHPYGIIEAGQTYCIEPMITNGNDNFGVCIDPDGWTFVTMDGKDSAFFEHMVKVTADGPEILTTHFTYERGKQ